MYKIILFANDQNDVQLLNMAIICVFDIITELFDIFPDWKRRQLLCLDELLRVIYENNELY